MADEFVNLKNADGHQDGGAYKNFITQIVKDGVCPFCPQYLSKYHKKPILRDGTHWILTENMYPYKGVKNQLLAIHKIHTESIIDISPDAWAELFDIVQGEAKKRDIQGGTFFMRFGNTDYTGATVTHLHAQLVSPDVENPNREPILARVG